MSSCSRSLPIHQYKTTRSLRTLELTCEGCPPNARAPPPRSQPSPSRRRRRGCPSARTPGCGRRGNQTLLSGGPAGEAGPTSRGTGSTCTTSHPMTSHHVYHAVRFQSHLPYVHYCSVCACAISSDIRSVPINLQTQVRHPINYGATPRSFQV